MIHALKTIRAQPPIFSTPLPPNLRRKTTGVGFRNQPEDHHDMDKTNNPSQTTGDVMSHSFGEAYATRCDEEGFGGIYGGNQSNTKTDDDEDNKIIHENHPDYDKAQGSEVKEKETPSKK